MKMAANGFDGSAPGNTKNRCASSKQWCFTWNNYSQEDYRKLVQFFQDNPEISYIVGKEIGGENKTPHLQGYIKFNKPTRPMEKLKWTNKIHWEKTKGSLQSNLDYCSKEGNFITNIKDSNKAIINKTLSKEEEAIELDILKHEDLFPWQIDILKIISEKPDKRIIHWIWEEKGNVGKTTFLRYLMFYHNAVPIEGKKNDILYCAAEHPSTLYIFDFERSMEDFISYAAMEKIKNACFMCSKYESKPIIRKHPHIICFANFEPNYEALSLDRWKVNYIGNNPEIIKGPKSNKSKNDEEQMKKLHYRSFFEYEN